MKNGTALIVLTCIFLAPAMYAQPSETRLTDSSGTYSFAVPAGWKSSADTEGFALENAEKTVILAIKAHNYKNFAAFAADANLERDGLELVGKPLEIAGGTAFRTTKKTPNGTIHIGTCVMFSPHGGGMVIVALSNEADAVTALESGWNVSQSVRFAKPLETASAGQSKSALSGKHLLYLYTGNGYSERKDIYLCASGGFYHSTSLSGFTPNNSNGGSFGSLASKHGTWTISGDESKLTLIFQNGRTTEYRIAKRPASNEIGLNGQRFFVTSQNVCG
jgi:hypothetical protein